MARLWQFFRSRRVLGVLFLAALGAWLYLEPATLRLVAISGGMVALVLAALWGIWWLLRYWMRQRSMEAAESSAPGERGGQRALADPGAMALLRQAMVDAIHTIKTSKLGLLKGRAALYELPWYLVIGNQAAGKSSLIERSGLRFPIAGSKATPGATGYCDWFFTPEGILLDTAGRYAGLDGPQDGDPSSVQHGTSNHAEWLGFLDLLRKHRKRAPVNGILVAVSAAELAAGDTAVALELAKNLRTRLQELTERLGVHAPVYIVFTKLDLIAGFSDFFQHFDRDECQHAWGATMRYNRRRHQPDVVAFFDQQVDILHEGLKELSLRGMAASRSTPLAPGVFTFPLEFAALKHPLRAFLATLFEENTYQFRPLFRGFYFTSALQMGAARDGISSRVAQRFDLDLPAARMAGAGNGDGGEQRGYFLSELFRKVIFADKELVRHYAAPGSGRWKYAASFAAVLVLGGALGGWTWSYTGNRQLIASVQGDLDKVRILQASAVDLQSHLAALEILQTRIVQLAQYRRDRPLAVSLGLYQGTTLERKLRDEYFAGAARIMLQPAVASMEALLAEVSAHDAHANANAKSRAGYEDAYNTLKAYLMLGDRSRAEAGHLHAQLTRHWRGWLEANRGAMPREALMRSAEVLLQFYVRGIDDPAWPQLRTKLALLDSARDTLRRVHTGTPARDRVYADIKSRAGVRFAPVTVARIVDEGNGESEKNAAVIVGTHAVPGAFTRAAWDTYVLQAIREVSQKELQSRDWVLQQHSRDDLTLLGSPEQIQAALTEMYKAEYVREWRRFVQGVSVVELGSFEASVRAMNRLGDLQTSPLARLFGAIERETSWDNPPLPVPSSMPSAPQQVQKGMSAWFKESVLRQAPSQARPLAEAALANPVARVDANGVRQLGTIGREFAALARLVDKRDGDASMLGGYLASLARLRTRLNQLKNQGDPGPGAKQFMQQTLEGSGSELADALKYVDEQMGTSVLEQQKLALRPLLVRPLLQTFATIVQPSEAEINKTWQVQVLEPFRRGLAERYPFAANARVEASSAEIAQVFGPEGQIAKFVATSLGPLVVRRGDTLEARTWAALGISLSPQAVADFRHWIAPLADTGLAGGSGPRTVFQLQPAPAPGTLEYTIEIDGQALRYRNTPPAWTTMVHPGPGGAPGARIHATTFDGRTVDVFNAPGEFGLRRLMASASRSRRGAGVFELSWRKHNVTVTVDFKITSSVGYSDGGGAGTRSTGLHGLRLPERIVGAAAPPRPTLAPAPDRSAMLETAGVQ